MFPTQLTVSPRTLLFLRDNCLFFSQVGALNESWVTEMMLTSGSRETSMHSRCGLRQEGSLDWPCSGLWQAFQRWGHRHSEPPIMPQSPCLGLTPSPSGRRGGWSHTRGMCDQKVELLRVSTIIGLVRDHGLTSLSRKVNAQAAESIYILL